MQSKSKHAQLAVMATLVVLLGATAAPNMASAQSGIQLAQADSGRREAQKPSSSRENRAQRAPRQAVRQDRPRATSTRTTTTRTIVRTDRPRERQVSRSDRRDRSRVVIRSRTTYVPFVVLGPRVVYRSYGAGWCRGLHRGRHWAPRIGWHAGTHVGPVRCG